jgi:hypothetical protein
VWGLFGIGGSAAKTDRNAQLTSWGQLQSLFGPAKAMGEQQTAAGAGGLTTARNYFEAIASGDPAKMSAVLAPQISTIQGQTGARVNTIGQFSGRSGGTAAQATDLGTEATRAIQNLFDLLGPEAMKEVAAISGTQEAFGQGETGIALSAAGEVGAQAGGARATDVPVQQAQQAAAMEAIVALAGL